MQRLPHSTSAFPNPRRAFPDARIVVTQPRRLAAVTLAKRVAFLLKASRAPLHCAALYSATAALFARRRSSLSLYCVHVSSCSLPAQEPVGQTVGYAIRGERVGVTARLTFCTTGWLLECAKTGSPVLDNATHIVLDEARQPHVLTTNAS